MNRGGFLRGLLAAPAIALGAVVREADVSEERTEVMSMHANDDFAMMLHARGKECGQPSKLAWSHDADGNWYVENTATGKVTLL